MKLRIEIMLLLWTSLCRIAHALMRSLSSSLEWWQQPPAGKHAQAAGRLV